VETFGSSSTSATAVVNNCHFLSDGLHLPSATLAEDCMTTNEKVMRLVPGCAFLFALNFLAQQHSEAICCQLACRMRRIFGELHTAKMSPCLRNAFLLTLILREEPVQACAVARRREARRLQSMAHVEGIMEFRSRQQGLFDSCGADGAKANCLWIEPG